MIDISEQIKNKICERIRPHLNDVKLVTGNYRRLEDLRVILKSLFPQERRFDNVEGTAWLLTKLFSKDEVFVIRNFENRVTKELMHVYVILQQSSDSQKPGRKTKNEMKVTSENREKYVNLDSVKSESVSAIMIPNTATETTAKNHERIRRNPNSTLNKFAYIPDLDLFFETIVRLAKPEDWAYGSQSGRFRYSILESYLNIVIDRLQYAKKVLNNNKIVECQCLEVDEKGNHKTVEKCVLNTGLVSRGIGNFIYIIFHKNNKPNAQEWYFCNPLDITDRKDSQSFLPFNGKFPEKPDFYATLTPSNIVFPDELSAINEVHILEKHCERLPIGFLKQFFGSYFTSRKKIPTNAEEWDDFRKYLKGLSRDDNEVNYGHATLALKHSIEKALRTAQGNDTARAKIYRPSKQSIGFFLPLYLEARKDDMDYDVGVIIAEDESNKGKYVARTIYRTSMAYTRIRVMGNHDRTWLDPKRIQYWINPCPIIQDEEDDTKLPQKQ